MALRSTDKRWGGLSRAFHWLMAILIIGAGCVGLYMADLPNSPQKIKIYAIHKSVGLTVLALVILRLAWRMTDRGPPPLSMPWWQREAAQIVHGLLYVLMFAIPLSGWLYNSASGYPLQWWWTVQMPSLTGGADPGIKAFAHDAHFWLFMLLIAALVAHAGAALKHHFFDRDATLARMLPIVGDPTPPAAPVAEPAPPPAVVVPEPVAAPDEPRSETVEK